MAFLMPEGLMTGVSIDAAQARRVAFTVVLWQGAVTIVVALVSLFVATRLAAVSALLGGGCSPHRLRGRGADSSCHLFVGEERCRPAPPPGQPNHFICMGWPGGAAGLPVV